jgi:poly-gamma-glutamate synthesis protein (capsule biosynthesis protein)
MAQSAHVRHVSTPRFFLLLAVAVVPLLGIGILAGGPSAGVGLASPSTGPPGQPTATTVPAGESSGPPSAQPVPSLSPLPLANVPIVPVADFRSPVENINIDSVRAVLAGTHARWRSLEMLGGDADGIFAALGLKRPADPTRLVLASSVKALERHLAADSRRLGFLRASQVSPAVRALSWTARALFGVDRLTSIAGWRLVARLPGDARPFNPGATWTLVAGGDILLDRGIYKQTRILGKGVDFPFDGGTAEITGRRCCSSFDWPIPVTRRTGDRGAVRDLLSGADIAVANFENPAVDAFRYHTQGTVFSADPGLIAGLRNAGIDAVSIANNHIGDAGRAGVVQTVANLDEYGIKHAGAGRNAVAAHRPAMIRVDGLTVAILGYDTIAGAYTAGASTPGSARLTVAGARADIAAARRAGADVVIVYPHWGIEYRATPFAGQQALARSIIDAGADMVIGNHAHWVGAMEVYKGRPIWYALGNFVFDQTWSEPTSEGLLLELTFSGRHLVQVRLHPTIILDGAQPNFLDPGGDGRVVLGQLYDASKKLLPW